MDPSYTYLKDLAANLETQLVKVANANVITIAQFKFIQDKPFIQCMSQLIYGPKSQSEGVLIQTLNTN